MFIRIMVVVVVAVISLAFLGSLPAIAQTSIGFADPGDTANLLDYRLPTWSYRTWEASFSLDGRGNDFEQNGQKFQYSRVQTELASDFRQTWESEPYRHTIRAYVFGDYLGENDKSGGDKQTYEVINGRFTLSGTTERYLENSPFFLSAGTSINGWYYEENADWGSGLQTNSSVSQLLQGKVRLGGGLGRVRNVTPLIRAERLSERLVALGRGSLTASQVQKVAAVLAQQYGYRQVFDRSDRYFWQDVLEPVLAGQTSLNAYEIMYLAEILNEDVGERYEGWQVALGGTYGVGNPGDEHESNSREAEVQLDYFHNFSLAQQIQFFAKERFSSSSYYDSEYEYLNFSLGAIHLWNIVDRHMLNTSVKWYLRNSGHSDRRDKTLSLALTWSTYLENRFSIETSLQARYRHDQDLIPDMYEKGWDWTYRLGLTYHLDRVLF